MSSGFLFVSSFCFLLPLASFFSFYLSFPSLPHHPFLLQPPLTYFSFANHSARDHVTGDTEVTAAYTNSSLLLPITAKATS